MIKRNYLPLNLQFFAEDGDNSADQSSAETQNTDTSNGVNNKPDTAPAQEEIEKKNEHMIPKSRFDEINNKNKELELKLNEFLSQQQEAERKAKEEQGKFQELYQEADKELGTYKSQLEQLQDKVQQFEKQVEERLNSKLEAIPEDYRDIIPDGLTNDQKLAWIERAEQKGIFGNNKADQPLGEITNPAIDQSVDLNKLDPFSLLKSGYGRRK